MSMLLSKRLFWGFSLGLVAMLGWFLFQLNPNVQFRQFKKQVSRSFQQEVSALSDTTYTLRIQEPKLLQAERRFYEVRLLNFLPRTPAGLNEKHKSEWFSLQKQMQERLQAIDRLRSDPSLYNLGGTLKQTIVNHQFTSNEKWYRIEKQLAEAPRYYTVAKDNLVHPQPEKVQLAIDKQLLTLQFLQTELPDSLLLADIRESQRDAILQNIDKARIAVKDYLAFCRSLLFEQQNATLR